MIVEKVAGISSVKETGLVLIVNTDYDDDDNMLSTIKVCKNGHIVREISVNELDTDFINFMIEDNRIIFNHDTKLKEIILGESAEKDIYNEYDIEVEAGIDIDNIYYRKHQAKIDTKRLFRPTHITNLKQLESMKINEVVETSCNVEVAVFDNHVMVLNGYNGNFDSMPRITEIKDGTNALVWNHVFSKTSSGIVFESIVDAINEFNGDKKLNNNIIIKRAKMGNNKIVALVMKRKLIAYVININDDGTLSVVDKKKFDVPSDIIKESNNLISNNFNILGFSDVTDNDLYNIIRIESTLYRPHLTNTITTLYFENGVLNEIDLDTTESSRFAHYYENGCASCGTYTIVDGKLYYV